MSQGPEDWYVYVVVHRVKQNRKHDEDLAKEHS